MLRLLPAAILAGLIGLAACDTGPTAPTSLTAPVSTHTESGPAETSAGASDGVQLQSLTDRLAELQSADRSAQTQQELDRIRALIAALTSQLKPDEGGGGGGEDPPTSNPVTVSIVGVRGSDSFSPNPISPGGQMVMWRNDDGLTHHIVADDGSFDTGNLVAGATSTMVQPPEGGYHCSIHPTMVGSIGGGDSTGGGGGGGGSDPYAVGR